MCPQCPQQEELLGDLHGDTSLSDHFHPFISSSLFISAWLLMERNGQISSCSLGEKQFIFFLSSTLLQLNLSNSAFTRRAAHGSGEFAFDTHTEPAVNWAGEWQKTPC